MPSHLTRMNFSAIFFACLVLLCVDRQSATAGTSFTGVIDVPPTVIPDSAMIGPNATVNLHPGANFGSNVEAVDSTINVVGAEFTLFGFVVGSGTEINLQQGSIEEVNAEQGSVVNIFGGTVGGPLRAGDGSIVNVTDGFTNSVLGDFGSVINIDGGRNDILSAHGELNIKGGTYGDGFFAGESSQVNIFGTEFFLDGAPLDTLVPGVKTLILERGVELTGTLVEGTDFDFILNSDPNIDTRDFFEDGSTVTVTLVPEPATIALFGILNGFLLLWRK